MKKQDVVSMLKEVKKSEGISDLTAKRIDNVIRLVAVNRSNVVDTGKLYMGVTLDSGVQLGYKYCDRSIMSVDMRCIYAVDSFMDVSKDNLYSMFCDVAGRQQLRDSVSPK